jgi:hypothetical protein
LADLVFAFGFQCIVGGLHAYPVDGAVAEQFAEPNRRPGVSPRIGLALTAGLYSLERKLQKRIQI